MQSGRDDRGSEADRSDRSDPVWAFFGRVYAVPGVSAAALVLQDEFGLEVTVLLACLQATRSRGRIPTVDEVLGWLAASAERRAHARTLRTLRRATDRRREPELRAALAKAELAAEAAVQRSFVLDPSRGAVVEASTLVAGLRVYTTLAGVEPPMVLLNRLAAAAAAVR